MRRKINISTFLNELYNRNIIIATDYHLYIYNDDDQSIERRDEKEVEAILKYQRLKASDQDIFIYLGDIFNKHFKNINMISEDDLKYMRYVVSKLNGVKILIKGNHDRLPNEFYIKLGFDYVGKSIQYKNILFTHKPKIVPSDIINIHGHLHGTRKYPFSSDNNVDIYAINQYHTCSLKQALDYRNTYKAVLISHADTNTSRYKTTDDIDGEELRLEDIIKIIDKD